MFTASHNPAEYNGVSAGRGRCRSAGTPAGRDQGHSRQAARGAEDPGRAERLSCPRSSPVLLRRSQRAPAPGWSPTRPTASAASSSPPCSPACAFELTLLYGELDGTFPNHPADPTAVENKEGPPARCPRPRRPRSGSPSGDADRVVLVSQSQPMSGSPPPRCSVDPRPAPGREDRAQPDLLGRPRGRARARWHADPYPGRPLVHQAGHGGDRCHLRREHSILLPRQLPRRLRHHRRPARARAAVNPTARSELRPVRRYAMSGEISRVPTRRGDRAGHGRMRGAEQDRLDGLTVDVGDWWFNLRRATPNRCSLGLERDRAATTREVLTLVRGD